MPKPKWLTDTPSKRERSDKIVKKLSKSIGARITANSGATLKQNDLFTDDLDIEHKFTDKSQYTLKIDELKKLAGRSGKGKIPVFMIDFAEFKKSYVVVEAADFLENYKTR